MITYQAEAHAKLNLTLDVLGKRSDGYHDLEMVMQEITLGDMLTVTLDTGEPWRMTSDSGEIPADETNLAVKAAIRFLEAAGITLDGLSIDIRKRTPVCSGMGGGSSDAAAVLRIFNDHFGHPLSDVQLYGVAESVGSDVPFALFGGTALAREKGQVLSRLPAMPGCSIVLCKPPFPISTPALFHAVDAVTITNRPDNAAMVRALEQGDFRKIAELLFNVFEPVVAKDHPEIGQIRSALLKSGALGAAMTGSGPTVFGLFAERAKAEDAFCMLSEIYPETFLTAPV